MRVVQLDGAAIHDWAGFHRECQVKFGFPDFYGRNMDAWIDCLSDLRGDDAMSALRLGPDEALQIEVLHADTLRRTAPDILAALDDCTDAVNERYAESGEKPALILVLR